MYLPATIFFTLNAYVLTLYRSDFLHLECLHFHTLPTVIFITRNACVYIDSRYNDCVDLDCVFTDCIDGVVVCATSLLILGVDHNCFAYKIIIAYTIISGCFSQMFAYCLNVLLTIFGSLYPKFSNQLLDRRFRFIFLG